MHFDGISCGHWIRIARKKAGMTQLELSLKLNVTEKHLSRIERGHQTASIDLLVDIAIVLNVSIDELVWGDSMSKRTKILRIKDELISIINALTTIANEYM